MAMISMETGKTCKETDSFYVTNYGKVEFYYKQEVICYIPVDPDIWNSRTIVYLQTNHPLIKDIFGEDKSEEGYIKLPLRELERIAIGQR